MIIPTMTKSGYNDVHKSSAMQIKALLASPAMYIGGESTWGDTSPHYHDMTIEYWYLIITMILILILIFISIFVIFPRNVLGIFDNMYDICDILQECFGDTEPWRYPFSEGDYRPWDAGCFFVFLFYFVLLGGFF